MAPHLCQCVTAVICVWGMFQIVMASPAMTSGSRQKRQDANMSASDNHTESIEDENVSQASLPLSESVQDANMSAGDNDRESIEDKNVSQASLPLSESMQDANMSASDNHTESIEDKNVSQSSLPLSESMQDANKIAGDNDRESIEDKHCYNEQDRGQSYAGKVRVTGGSKKCLPWSEMTNCPYHSYKVNHDNTLLEENFCRNPDQKTGTKPWCYTGREKCAREDCDVDVCSSESTISCGPPPAVSDGELTDAPQASYSVGDKVLYNCSLWSNTRERICLSSGNWSELGFVCGVCPDGWILFQGKCYRKFNNGVVFNEAKMECQRYGAEIASPKSRKESVFLRNNFYANEFWIGLTQETTWQWLDGQPIELKQWGKGYPYVKNNELCAVMTSSSQWKDEFCRKKKGFVCSVGNNFAKGDAPCLDYSDACPLYFKDNGNVCVEFPDFALAQCRFTCGLCDIDATPKCAVEAPGDNAIIMNGSSSDDISRGETVTYACQEGFDPLHGDIVRGCGASGKLVGTPLECSPGCDERWTFLRETQSCYKYIDDPQDYFTARLFCKSLEGNLATPKTLEQNVFVDEIRTANDSSKPDIWIGMNDLTKPNTFGWDDKEQLTYSRWARNEPSKQTGDNCGSMSKGAYWADKQCESTINFVCQVPKNKSSVTINELKPCPKGWKLDKGTCYKLAAVALNYHDSRKVCEFEDALIAMPKSSEKHNFLVDKFGQKIWLGVTDIVEERFWVFEDGRPVSIYQRWRKNQPPGKNDGKNCLTFDNNAKWVDVACHIKKRLVCEKPAQDVGESGNADQGVPSDA